MDNLLDPSLYTASGSGSGSGSDRYPDPISASLDTKTHLLAEDMAMIARMTMWHASSMKGIWVLR